MLKKGKFILLVVAVFILGLFVGKLDLFKSSITSIKRNVTETIADVTDLDDRKLVLLENPMLVNRIMEGGAFGNANFSIEAAQNMFGNTEEAIEDIITKTTIEQINEKVWVIHLPIVNCSVIETDEGLIVIDTGMKPAGPAILKSIKSISDKPIHTIIYTHGHVDHAYGTWALINNENPPDIIAHKNLPKRFARYIELRGSLAKYMSQPEDQLPKDSSDFIWPTITFEEEYELKVGGEKLILKHFKGETDDQLMVWMPSEKILFGADYYQGFLPNAGNGKRMQRYIKSWIEAFAYMQGLKAQCLVPSHGDVIIGHASIDDALGIHHDALKYIYDYTVSALNEGMRKDLIVQEFTMPEKFKKHPLLREQYVTAQDICKMIIKFYSGWWDDIPSHWSPAAMKDQANSIVDLAGGLDQLLEHINVLKSDNLILACHFIDWAYYAYPEDPNVLELVLEIYEKRIMDDRSMTQEMLVYLDHMTNIRGKLK